MGKHRYKPEDISYGIIPYCVIDTNITYLLIQHRAGHRAFPKGHADGDETHEQTALRELYEETGIQSEALTITDPDVWFTEKYTFRYRGAPVRKTVHYLLGQCLTKIEINIQIAEIKDHKRCTYDQALEYITFDEGKGLLTKIHNVLSGS